MSALQDAKYAKMETALVLTGGEYDIIQMEQDYIISLDATVTRGQVQDMWHEYWDNLGTVVAGSFNDRAFDWLGDLLYTGSLEDRWYAYWSA